MNLSVKTCRNRQKALILGLFRSFMIKNFSVPQRNRQFVFAPKIQYEMAAESAEKADKLRKAVSSDLPFSTVSSILNFGRTHFERPCWRASRAKSQKARAGRKKKEVWEK